MNILGISCGHDANVCIVNDEKILVHLEKERFTRRKRDVGKVDELIRIALEVAELQFGDIDIVASSVPVWEQYGHSCEVVSGEIYESLFDYSHHKVRLFDRELPAVFVPHHVGHMAYAYYLSGFESADIISVDAFGNFTATAIGVGEGQELHPRYDLYPSNIGSLWCIVSRHIFGSLFDAGKTMGLAPYGQPSYLELLKRRYKKHRAGWPILDDPWVDNEAFPILSELSDDIEIMHPVARDMAASVQALTNEIMLEYAQETRRQNGNRNLCLAGGVALNGISNELIDGSGLYDKVFVGPATNDAGLSIGFALYALHHILGKPKQEYADCVYLSKDYDHKEFKNALNQYRDLLNIDNLPRSEVTSVTADLLIEGAIVGWFQGRAESGPRALGHRSILCNPAIDGMKDHLNIRVKHRESFRPFAPSVIGDAKERYFELHSESPYMLRIVPVKPNYHSVIPAVVHVDGSSRPQTVEKEENPLYYDLLRHVGEKTGSPILLNTSFNVRGEPIVESPEDAVKCFLSSEIDYLVMDNLLISK